MLQVQEVFKFRVYQAERKFLRVDVCLSAQYESKACTVVNVSSGGAGLIFVEPVVVGNIVKIEVQTDSGSTVLHGKIVWSKDEGRGVCPAGIEFCKPLSVDVFLDLVEEESSIERR